MKNKLLSWLLIFLMVFSMLPKDASANVNNNTHYFEDMPNDWSTAALKKAVNNGLLKGCILEGKTLINADAPLKRAEMAAIVNRAFGAVKNAELYGVADVQSSAWYADDMAKAIMMGTFIKDTKMRPENNITRQEAFAVLARAFNVSPDALKYNALESYSDKDDIAEWAKENLNAMIEAGYVQGSNFKLNPNANISRAEFATVMDNLVKEYIDMAGVVTDVSSGNVLIRVPGVTLNNLTVKGDLIITDGVGNGEVTLDNVNVEGRTIVRGGGEDSIIIKGNSNLGKTIVCKVDGRVRIVVEGEADVDVVYVDDGSDDVFVEGVIGTLEVAGDYITAVATKAILSNAIVSGDNSVIILREDSTMREGKISGTDSQIIVEKSAAVDRIIVEGLNSKIEGNGNIKNVEVMYGSTNASITTPNTKIETEKGAEGVTAAGGTPVEGGTSVTNNSRGTGIVTPRTSGSSGTTSVLVSTITVKGTDNMAEITTTGGALQMKATVEPSNAGNKSVTWSVDDETIATISTTGLLTAKANGTVVVKAKAKDGSNKEGAAAIVISNQEVMFADKNITSLATLTDIIVANGTEISSAGLSATIEVTLDDSSKQNLTVTWDDGTPAYNKDTAGEYVFAGTLTLPADVTNTGNLKASVKVIVAAPVYPEITNFTFTATDSLKAGSGNVGVGALAGTFSVPVGGTSPFTYSLAAGDGDTDNSKFAVDGLNLIIQGTALTEGTYNVRVRITDSKSKIFEKVITITVDAADTVIDISAIPGVTAPVTEEAPVTSITETAQYTGIVVWSPDDNSFQKDTVYTATITLTPKEGFSLTGVAENLFTVEGATATNATDSGVVTAVFPKTGPAPEFAGGDGTDGNPYQVATAEHLNNVRNHLSAHFVQTADIDLTTYLAEGGAGYNSGAGWEPIGTDSAFTGNFNGNGKKISNLKIDRSSLIGLFGQNEGVIRNVSLIGVEVSGTTYVGGLVGYNYQGAVIDSNVTGSIISDAAGEAYVGGLIGYNREMATVRGCYSAGSVSAPTGDYVGGLIGGNDNYCLVDKSFSASTVTGGLNRTGGLIGQNYNSTIVKCFATGNVTGIAYVGGLVGENNGSSNIDSYATGAVTGTGGYVGGLVGRNFFGPTVTNCYAIGSVTGTGGLIGGKQSGDIVTNSYWDTETSGMDTSVSGEGKTTAEMQTKTTFVDWDFDTIWDIDPAENNGYPFLR
mgnify:CR=1 FL=1|jgi:hypothetical protein